jgi:hypothetical protein
MAEVLINVHVERVEAQIAPPGFEGQVLRVTWQGMKGSTGQVYDTVVEFSVPDPSVFLTQANWDTIFATGMTQLAEASGGEGPATNPVDL